MHACERGRRGCARPERPSSAKQRGALAESCGRLPPSAWRYWPQRLRGLGRGASPRTKAFQFPSPSTCRVFRGLRALQLQGTSRCRQMGPASHTRQPRHCVSGLSGTGRTSRCPLPEPNPFFSPDGEWLAFFTEKGLHRIPAGGGAVELITAERSGRERTFGGSWGPAGHFFSRGGGLLRVSAEGDATEVVAEPDMAAGEVRYAWPEFLPDGQSVLFTILRTESRGRQHCCHRSHDPKAEDDPGRRARATISADRTPSVRQRRTAPRGAVRRQTPRDSSCFHPCPRRALAGRRGSTRTSTCQTRARSRTCRRQLPGYPRWHGWTLATVASN